MTFYYKNSSHHAFKQLWQSFDCFAFAFTESFSQSQNNS